MPAEAELDAAWKRVSKLVAPSPLIRWPGGEPECWLKLEMLHPTGSFKVRGATAALSALPEGTRVVTCSAGNHGLATAYVARRLGIHACVVVSAAASPRKIELLRASADELVIAGANYDEAERHGRDLAEARGAYFLSPYNDPDVILGQASLGLELLAQFDGPVSVVCPVGGGGLAAGIGLALARRPGSRLFAVEAARSAPMRVALAQRRTVRIEVGETLADGLAGNLEDGTVTVALLARQEAVMLAVSEDEIRTAMRRLATHGIIAEGAGAVALAAVLARGVPSSSERPLIALVTGCNVERKTWLDAVDDDRPHAEPVN